MFTQLTARRTRSERAREGEREKERGRERGRGRERERVEQAPSRGTNLVTDEELIWS